MRFMENLASLLMPSPAVYQPKRNEAEGLPTIKASFPAGQITSTTSSWNTVPQSPSQIIFQELTAIRARSRQQYGASDYIKRYTRLVRSNVAGPEGMGFQSHARSADGKLDIDLGKRVEREVNRWLKRGVDFYGEQEWPELLSTIMTTLPIDGEVFARIRTGRDAGPWGLSVQLIDAELINVSDFRQLRNGNIVRFGIELDRQGRRVAYHISPNYGYGIYSGIQDPERPSKIIRVPAKNMLHVFDREYVGQLRGIPWTVTAIPRTWQMEKYDEAALVNARWGAGKMVFFKTPDGEGQYSKADGDKWPNGYKVQKMVPGATEELPPGVEPIGWDPTYPNNEYGAFSERNLRGASAGLDVSYESIANDRTGVNFSSIRAGVMEDRETWKSRQLFVNRTFCDPLIERFFSLQATKQGSVFFNPTQYPEQFEDITEHSWQNRTWAPIQPVHDVTASKMEIEMGVKSRAQHMREMNRDPADTWEEIAKEGKIMSDLGVGEPEPGSAEIEVDDDADR